MRSTGQPRTLRIRVAWAGAGLLSAATLLSACATNAAPTPGVVVDEAVQRGADYAMAYCSGCHNIGTSGESVYRAAPAFRNLRGSWSSMALELRLSRAAGGPHYGMPPRILLPSEAHDLAAFIQNQRQPDPSKRMHVQVTHCIGVSWC